MQTTGGVCGGNRQTLHQQHVASVQALIHLHDGHARFSITSLNGPMNGRSTPPARQQGGMNVQTPQARQLQRPAGQYQTIGGHHHHIGTGCQQGFPGRSSIFRVLAVQLQAQRLRNGYAVLGCQLLHWRSLQLHATARRTVWLREHQRHLKASLEQSLQRHGGKFWRAGKHNFHARPFSAGHRARP